MAIFGFWAFFEGTLKKMAPTSTLEVGLRVHDQYRVPDSDGMAWVSGTRHLNKGVSSVGNPTLVGLRQKMGQQ